MSEFFPSIPLLESKQSMNPGKAGNFLGCSKDVFHRNAELRGGEEGDPSAFCTRENWQSAVIYLSQAGRQVISQLKKRHQNPAVWLSRVTESSRASGCFLEGGDSFNVSSF